MCETRLSTALSDNGKWRRSGVSAGAGHADDPVRFPYESNRGIRVN